MVATWPLTRRYYLPLSHSDLERRVFFYQEGAARFVAGQRFRTEVGDSVTLSARTPEHLGWRRSTDI